MDLFKKMISILAKTIVCVGIVGCLITILFFYYLLGTHKQNISSEPRFSEVYKREFIAQTDLFLYKYLSGYEPEYRLCRHQIHENNIEQMILEGMVERGCKLRVVKILKVTRPLVGSNIKVIVEIKDDKFASHRAKSKKAINAIWLTNGDKPGFVYESIELQFNPEILSQI
jgi:hypothetical protein